MASRKCTTMESAITVSGSLEIGLDFCHTPRQLREWLSSSGVKDEIAQGIPEHTLVALLHSKIPVKLQLQMRREPTGVTYVALALLSSIPTEIE